MQIPVDIYLSILRLNLRVFNARHSIFLGSFLLQLQVCVYVFVFASAFHLGTSEEEDLPIDKDTSASLGFLHVVLLYI